MHEAQLGDRVRVQYFRIPERGTDAEKHRRRRSCEFHVGGNEVCPTLSSGVVGMTPGDRKQLVLQPWEAFGTVQSKLTRNIPRDRFPSHLKLSVGQRLRSVSGTSRRSRRVVVVELRPDSVIVNGNHPRADQGLELEVVLIQLDSTPNANPNRQQFDQGGEGG